MARFFSSLLSDNDESYDAQTKRLAFDDSIKRQIVDLAPVMDGTILSGDEIDVFVVQSSAVIREVNLLASGAAGAATTVDVGFAYIDGDVIDDDALDSALAWGGVILGTTPAYDGKFTFQKAWELAGLTEDPNRMLAIRFLFNADAENDLTAGTVVAYVDYI